MTLLPWRRHGPQGRPVVVALHAWGRSARLDFAATGLAGGIAERGLALLAPDLPGHGDAVEVQPPPGTDPAAWTAELLAADLQSRWRGPLVVVGHRDGARTAAHLAARGELPVAGVAAVDVDDRGGLPLPASAAAQLRSPGATVWDPQVAGVLDELRRGDGVAHATLAQWLADARWPARPRLAALECLVRVVVDAADAEQAERAPTLAAWFGDAAVVAVGGDGPLLGRAAVADEIAQLAGHDAD